MLSEPYHIISCLPDYSHLRLSSDLCRRLNGVAGAETYSFLLLLRFAERPVCLSGGILD